MCGPHASLCSSAASHPTYGPSHPDPAGGSFKQNRISSISEQLLSKPKKSADNHLLIFF